MRVMLGVGALCVGAFFLTGLSQEKPVIEVGEYTTSLEGRDASQRHNATLCLDKVDGVVIPPGGMFSFNEVVGPWSRDQGYRRAPVSYSGQLIDAWGGGVCQSSTTIYNAALVAGLEVPERHAHHYAPSYVEPGRDAAVAYPNIDLKIKNPYDVPVTLNATVSNGRIIASWTGQVGQVKKSKVSVRLITAHQPQSIEVGRGGRQIVRNVGKPGFEVEVFRTVDGVQKMLSRDHYEVMNRVVERTSSK